MDKIPQSTYVSSVLPSAICDGLQMDFQRLKTGSPSGVSASRLNFHLVGFHTPQQFRPRACKSITQIFTCSKLCLKTETASEHSVFWLTQKRDTRHYRIALGKKLRLFPASRCCCRNASSGKMRNIYIPQALGCIDLDLTCILLETSLNVTLIWVVLAEVFRSRRVFPFTEDVVRWNCSQIRYCGCQVGNTGTVNSIAAPNWLFDNDIAWGALLSMVSAESQVLLCIWHNTGSHSLHRMDKSDMSLKSRNI